MLEIYLGWDGSIEVLFVMVLKKLTRPQKPSFWSTVKLAAIGMITMVLFFYNSSFHILNAFTCQASL